MSGGEFLSVEEKEVKKSSVENYTKIRPEKEMSTKDINDAVKDEFDKSAKVVDANETDGNNDLGKLTDEEIIRIKNETGWPDEIIKYIDNMDQYEIYKKADLHAVMIDGRLCLVKDIDMDYVDPKTGKTNRELMNDGRSPIDSKTGERIELHHMGQKYDAPFAELNEKSEHGDGNDKTLHPNSAESWRNEPSLKSRYDNVDRPQHWKARAKEGLKG